MADENESLEQSGIKEPELEKILDELQQAAVDSDRYRRRVAVSCDWWNCYWDNQSIDGRRWGASGQEDKVFPWNGCSDSRLRIVDTIVQEHVTLALTAFWSAKVQAKSIRPFVSGRNVNVTQRMLNWRVYTHMKRELLTELPRAFAWKYATGLSFIGITWEQQRELVYVPITIDMILQLAAQLGLGDVQEMLLDPDKMYDDQLIPVLQQISPVLPTGEARKILNDLRLKGQADLPIANLRVNKPRWLAKRPVIDVLFPSETSDIQYARFTSERELVSESDLIDRIETDGYDPRFVEEALHHKGQFSDWNNRGYWYDDGSDRDMVELHHFISRKIDYGVPCLYRTVFCEAVVGDELYALHRKFEYDHQQQPLISLRRTHTYRPLLSSVGIAEEAYTDEMDLKKQQDGLNDRTELIHQPPMIVPTLRAQAQAHAYGPRAVMTSLRPNDVNWPPLPPMDQTPVIVMQMVQDRLDRRYAIIGGVVDPEIKAVRRQQLATQDLGELELALEQTLQLMQQFETDADVQRVAGGGQPWQFSVKDIQGQHEITATVDMKMIDLEYAGIKLDMFAKILPYRESGGAVFGAMAQILDPDLADMLEESQASPAAMEKERESEYNAVGQILAGMEPIKPMMAMNELRLKTIQEIMMDQQTQMTVMQDPVKQERLKNRVKFFQNQIQQFQKNPEIGRTLATQTFAPSEPAQVSRVPAQ